MPRKDPAEKHSIIIGMFTRGMTYEAIGKEFGVTRQRIEQIMRKNGIKADQGGKALRALTKIQDQVENKKRIEAEREERFLRRLGCSIAEADRINGCRTVLEKKSTLPSARYISQKENALRVGKGWEITLPEWWAIWQESGKWHLRGRGQGYCMARYGDSGPYKVGNVYICTIGQNFSDSYIVHPWHERFPKSKGIRVAKKGYFVESRRFIARFRGKRLGSFGTPKEARSAYLRAYNEFAKTV